ncbi:hypothetical protein A2U01_0048237, partial [Trifolium medium]|nr:hypothetical protein [Trifolium medium]
PMVAGCKIFMRAKGIPRDEEEEVHLVRLRMVVARGRFKPGSLRFKDGESITVVDDHQFKGKVENCAGSWARGANMSRNTACCARRRPMSAGRAYELGRFGCC